METILKMRDICKEHHSCYDDCPFHVDHECVLTIPPANWSDEDLYLISKALEQESRWIPVSEKLPEAEYGESDSVLVCFESETQDVLYFDGSNWRYPTGETYISVNHKNGWHNKVIAWMPLPKPYVSQESKDKEFHCGIEESGGHAYNCNDCPNKCEEYHQWDKEIPAPLCGDTVIGKEKQKEYIAHDSAVSIMRKYQKIEDIYYHQSGEALENSLRAVIEDGKID